MRLTSCLIAALFASACSESAEAPDAGLDAPAANDAVADVAPDGACPSLPPCPVLAQPPLAWRVSHSVFMWDGGSGYNHWSSSFDQTGAFEALSSFHAGAVDGGPTVTNTVSSKLSDDDLNRMRCLLESPQIRAALASSGCTSATAPLTADGSDRLLVSAGGEYELWPNCGPPGCDLIEVLRDAINDVLSRPRGDSGI